MNQKTEEKHGITSDKLRLTKLFRKVMFVRMLCSPIFILVYWYFCRTLYKFCMYGGVKKRGSILAVCVIFFLAYLIYYYVRVRKIKVAEKIPEKISMIKWYGFSKDSFYCIDKDNCFCVKQCNDEEKDYLHLKYSELPKYKHFFWKIPAYLILLLITVVTICGVIKSGTNLNGKLAWYLFDLRHTPIVAEQPKESSTEQEDSTIIVQEIVGETIEEVGSVQEESSNNENGVMDESIPMEYPYEESYGTIQLAEQYYEDENGKIEYHYEVYQYIFSDSKYQNVNETLQSIYAERELEYQERYELEGSLNYLEPVPEGQKDYEERIWYLANLTYVGEDYVSLLFNDVTNWPGAAHPMSYFSPVTIDVRTGEVVETEEILGYTRDELSKKLYGDNRLNSMDYGFYLYGEEIHFIYRFSYFVDEIVISRTGIGGEGR